MYATNESRYVEGGVYSKSLWARHLLRLYSLYMPQDSWLETSPEGDSNLWQGVKPNDLLLLWEIESQWRYDNESEGRVKDNLGDVSGKSKEEQVPGTVQDS